MATAKTAVHPPSAVSASSVVPSAAPADFPPDVLRLLEVFARIERRRQARLAAERAQAFPAQASPGRSQEAR